MYLLDTNICIFAIKKRPEGILGKIQKNLDHGIFVSSLTIAELEIGVENSQRPEENRLALVEFLSIFDYLNFDDEDAIAYGKLKVHLRLSGTIIGPIDLLLASQALSKGLIMVTNNIKEFSRVPVLKVKDWTV